MNWLRKAPLLFLTLCPLEAQEQTAAPAAEPAAQEEAPAAEPPAAAEETAAGEPATEEPATAVEEDGDTPLIRVARETALMGKASAEQYAELRRMLQEGADPLEENRLGCNAMFYLHGVPGLADRLKAEKLLPPELALRVPAGKSDFLLYLALRAAQANLTEAPGSLKYLSTRYCKPVYTRTQELLAAMLKQDSLTADEIRTMADCLAVMRAADPKKSASFINKLPYWKNSEQMIHPIPLALVRNLAALHWKVDTRNLRAALDKLALMLPANRDDMIDCAAGAPARSLMALLVEQEGKKAEPVLRRFAKAYDPDAAYAALELLLQLKGCPLPEVQGTPATPLEAYSEAAHVDAAVYHGTWQELEPAAISRAAALFRALGLPLHAEMLENLVQDGTLAVDPDDALDLRYRYEEINEPSPRTTILRRLLDQQDPAATPLP